jgi:hypothetical protein
VTDFLSGIILPAIRAGLRETRDPGGDLIWRKQAFDVNIGAQPSKIPLREEAAPRTMSAALGEMRGPLRESDRGKTSMSSTCS